MDRSPTPDEIRARDSTRLLESLSAPVEPDEEDRLLAGQLMEKLPPEAIAAALARSLRSDLPAPEDILAAGGREDRGEPGPRARIRGIDLGS